MYLSIYLYIYTYVYTHVYIYIHIYTYVYVYVYVYVDVYVYVYNWLGHGIKTSLAGLGNQVRAAESSRRMHCLGITGHEPPLGWGWDSCRHDNPG